MHSQGVRALRSPLTWAVALATLGVSGAAEAALGLRNPVASSDQGTFAGSVAGQQAGGALVYVPDFNGDGLPDIAVGIPGRGDGAGAVAVFFGGPDQLTGELEISDADLLFVGESAGDSVGFSIAAGDFNRDGLSDLVLGAPGHTSGRGAAYVVFGAATRVGDPLNQRLDTQVKFTGEDAADRAGFAVAATDLDGDGASDVVVGAPYNTWGGRASGRVYARWGGTGATAGWSSTTLVSGDITWSGYTDFNLGYALSGVRNLNGDTKQDLIIGAPGGGLTLGSLNSVLGRAYVILGRVRADLEVNTELTLYADGCLAAENVVDFTGGAVVALNDMTGDGLSEFAVGAPLAGSGAGKVYLMRGKRSGYSSSCATDINTLSLGSFVGQGTNAHTGWSLSSLQDLSGDGLGELIIGAPGSTGGTANAVGEAYVVLGKASGWAKDKSLADPANSWGSFIGVTAGGEFGAAVGTAADIDQDGRYEMLVAAPFGQVGGEQVGVVHAIDVAQVQDLDSDGYSLALGDCNDEDDTVRPGAAEVPYDGIDQNCDGVDLQDVDEDGFEAVQVGGDDCNDDALSIYPGAEEVPYDGIDQNCDGKDLTDVDGDGYNGGIGPDCDDTNPSVRPGGTEIPYDGIDQDCSGADLTDADGDGYDSLADADGDDCDDGNSSVFPGAPETPYDGVDQDCSGADFDDVDGDGHSADFAGGDDCDDTDAEVSPEGVEVCDAGATRVDDDCDGKIDEDFDQDGDGHTDEDLCPLSGDDCDDDDETSYPGAREVCDEADNDCDGQQDENLPLRTFWVDSDSDGYGDEDDPGNFQSCLQAIDGYAANQTDCDDSDADVNPGALEVPGNGVDDDCDPETTDDDLDGDGYANADFGGDDCNDRDAGVNPGANDIPYDGIDQDCSGEDLNDIDLDGYLGGPNGDDCEDTNNTVYPGAVEIPYDGVDQDCSGADLSDIDGDGYVGTPGSPQVDCDDTDPEVNPGASEQCNFKDDDCDGNQDEGCSAYDVDGDGFFADVDCNDQDPDVYPNAVEFCDSEVDLNCDGKIGDDCATIGGGWGCSSAGARGGGAGAWLLALGLIGAARRRSWLAAMLGVALPAAAAHAQEANPVELNQMERPTDPQGLLSTVSAQALVERQFSFGLFFNYMDQPLQLHYDGAGGGSQALLASQSVMDLTGSYGLTRWLQVGVGIPLVVTQATALGSDVLGEVGGVTPGDARVQLKLAAPQGQGPWTAALVPVFRVPLSDGGRMAVDVLGAVQRQAGRLKIMANGGYRAYLGDTGGPTLAGYESATSALLFRGGLSLAAVPQTLDLMLDVWGQRGRDSSALVDASPLEIGVGAKLHPSGGMYALAGAGTALNGGLGAAKVRAFVGVGYASSTGLTDADSDGDGVPDVWDECRRAREDLDGWLDTDGCPDNDNDGDGVPDGEDACPDTAEDGDNWDDEDGCPEDDNDGDEIADGDDVCPDEPEDIDGFEDSDGCPDLDDDGDGVPDVSDPCPNAPELAGGDGDGCPDNDSDQDGVADALDQCPDRSEDMDGWVDTDGCPDFDNDGDGLPDFDDFCPDVAEDANGFRDDDGCPESGPQVVRVRDEVRVLEELRFEGGIGAPDPKSQEYLGSVFKLLSAAPAGSFITIEVHSDNQGDPAQNKDMTQAQAQQVEAWLVQKGLSRERLTAVGYGQERPLATNRTERGRERNRRVVFVISDTRP